jgi:hypothetical protein
MRGQLTGFNTYLTSALALVAALTLGCKSTEEKQREHTRTTLWLHLETAENSPDTNHVMKVEIAGASLNCDTRPFLTDENLLKAEIAPMPEGGQALRLQFDERGRLIIDQYTNQHRFKRVIFFAEWGVDYDRKSVLADWGFRQPRQSPKTKLTRRWLAAPRMTRRVSDGTIVFTPDLSSEELDQLVLGLNNKIKENQKPWVF